MYTCTSWCICENQRAAVGVGSLHPTMWTSVIELRLLGLVESSLLTAPSHQALTFSLAFWRQDFMYPRLVSNPLSNRGCHYTFSPPVLAHQVLGLQALAHHRAALSLQQNQCKSVSLELYVVLKLQRWDSGNMRHWQTRLCLVYSILGPFLRQALMYPKVFLNLRGGRSIFWWIVLPAPPEG